MCTPHTGRAWNYANNYGTEFRRETTFYGCFCLHLREHRKICDEKQKNNMRCIQAHNEKTTNFTKATRSDHGEADLLWVAFVCIVWSTYEQNENMNYNINNALPIWCIWTLHVYYFFAAFYWFSTDFSARIRFSRTFISIVVLMISTRLLSTSHFISGTILLPSQTWTKINC